MSHIMAEFEVSNISRKEDEDWQKTYYHNLR